MDTGSIFELASVSKQFTSMVIMMLQEQGKLNYDDSVKQYIPNLPYYGITIRHLFRWGQLFLGLTTDSYLENFLIGPGPWRYQFFWPYNSKHFGVFFNQIYVNV